MAKHIKCAQCRFTRQDKKASEYTKKRCGVCGHREDCEVCQGCAVRDECKARKNPKIKQSCERRLDTICTQQVLIWPAIQCVNLESEYHRALLNVTLRGDMQDQVTWVGCPLGEERRGQ